MNTTTQDDLADDDEGDFELPEPDVPTAETQAAVVDDSAGGELVITDDLVAVTEPVVAEESDFDEDDEEAFRLSLVAVIEEAGPCRKHVRITVPRGDISHFYEAEIGDLVGSAQVPGFRIGHVPKKLIEKRFRKELSDQVKQKVLVSSLEQVAEDYDLDPINEPEIDVESIEIPEEGDFEFEFNVEVRPEFDLPEYAGLTIERPVRKITDSDVTQQTEKFLTQYSQTVSHEGAAEAGDPLTLSAEFQHAGKPLSKIAEFQTDLKPVIRFQDAEIQGFDNLMNGVRAGDVRETELTVSAEAETLEMRGETVQVVFKVKEVNRCQPPEMSSKFLTRIGVESEEELQDEVRASLERQMKYEQRQAVRRQVLEKITDSANWELPEEMVRNQAENALRREMLEMEQAGFTTEDVRSRENEIRQHAISTTTRALKEHFVLDKIATEEEIEVTAYDLDYEIQMMAMQRGESPRRVRARLEKTGMDENLEAQIRERKAVDFVLKKAKYVDVKSEMPGVSSVSAIAHSVCGMTTDTEATPNAEEQPEESAES